LYETLLKSYMKWNWMKSNGLNNTLNDDKILNMFEMEMDYYNQMIRNGLLFIIWLIRCVQNYLCDIVKLNEQQLDDVIELFMDGLVDEYIHEICALSIAEIAFLLNERQLNKVCDLIYNDIEKRTLMDILT
ncbi:hypothetical protein RFI_35364, partial [Reticulomyxa filosa]